jgi:hypothetical protein
MTQTTQAQAPSGGRADTVTAGAVVPNSNARCRLRPVPIGAVEITGGLWAARRHANGSVAVPNGRERLESAGSLDKLRIAAGKTTGVATEMLPGSDRRLPHDWAGCTPDERRTAGYHPLYGQYATPHHHFGAGSNDAKLRKAAAA